MEGADMSYWAQIEVSLPALDVVADLVKGMRAGHAPPLRMRIRFPVGAGHARPAASVGLTPSCPIAASREVEIFDFHPIFKSMNTLCHTTRKSVEAVGRSSFQPHAYASLLTDAIARDLCGLARRFNLKGLKTAVCDQEQSEVDH